MMTIKRDRLPLPLFVCVCDYYLEMVTSTQKCGVTHIGFKFCASVFGILTISKFWN